MIELAKYIHSSPILTLSQVFPGMVGMAITMVFFVVGVVLWITAEGFLIWGYKKIAIGVFVVMSITTIYAWLGLVATYKMRSGVMLFVMDNTGQIVTIGIPAAMALATFGFRKMIRAVEKRL